MKRIHTRAAVAILAITGSMAASADTSSNEAFTAVARVLGAGPPASIEIALGARIELAGFSLSSSRGTVAIVDCNLQALAAGAKRTCRVSLSAPANEKYLTLQVAAKVAAAVQGTEPQLEIENFTFENKGFSPAMRTQSTQSRLQAR